MATAATRLLRYSVRAAEFLVNQGIKYLVIACSTASFGRGRAAARAVRAHAGRIGVIEPSSIAGCAASEGGHIAVLATEGTGARRRLSAANRSAAADGA